MAEQLEFSFRRPGEIPPGYVRTDYIRAHAGGPPNDWWQLVIVNLETGDEIPDVVEACTKSGNVIVWTPDFDQHCLRHYKNIAICKRAER